MVNDKEFYYCERCEKETMYKMRITDKRVVYECEDCTQLVTDDEVIRYNRLKMLENIFLNMLLIFRK